MTLAVDIDHARRRVVTHASGKLSKEEFVIHIGEVWSRPEVQAFDEIIDAREADAANLSERDLWELVNAGVAIDSTQTSKLALCVSDELNFAIGRMYSSMRETQNDNAREVRVFRNLDEAHQWLDDRQADE